LVLPTDAHFNEKPLADAKPPGHGRAAIMYYHENIRWYARYLYSKPHENFIGLSEASSDDFIIVSMEST